MTKQGLLIVISGPSGTGKGTVCKELLKRNDFWLSVSATTRSPRKGEIHGKEYYFLDKEEFEQKLNNKDFIEYAKVYGNYYGTPKSEVRKKLNEGKDVILEIDIQGALNVKKACPEGVFIFILPPSLEELKRRIVNRKSETEESLKIRLESAVDEINYVKEYNYAVMNDEVEKAAKKIEYIINAERCKVNRIKENVMENFKIEK